MNALGATPRSRVRFIASSAGGHLATGGGAAVTMEDPRSGAAVVLTNAVRFNSVSGPNSIIKNDHIERHDQADQMATTLNSVCKTATGVDARLWSLIMPKGGNVGRLSDVFTALDQLRLQFDTIVYAACRVRA